MATRTTLEELIDLASRSLNAGNDTGVLAEEDAAAATATAPPVLAEPPALTTATTADAVIIDPKPLPVDTVKTGMLNNNPDTAFALSDDQIKQAREGYYQLVRDLKAKATELPDY